jgi:hypothetical protein
MARWMLLNLGNGEYEGNRVISERSLVEIFAPQMIGDRESPFNFIPAFSKPVYTFGWHSAHFRGNQMYFHTGGIDGFTAKVTLLPHDGFGIAMFMNLNCPLAGVVMMSMTWELIDRLLGLEPVPWVEKGIGFVQMMLAQMEQGKAQKAAQRKKDTFPSRSLEDFAGHYHHPAYGDLNLMSTDGRLEGRYNHLKAHLEHLQNNLFCMHLEMPYPENNFELVFQPGLDGGIEKALICFDQGRAEIPFKRVLFGGEFNPP